MAEVEIALENLRTLHLTDSSVLNQAFVGLAGNRVCLFF